jgi:hypothetical protein
VDQTVLGREGTVVGFEVFSRLTEAGWCQEYFIDNYNDFYSLYDESHKNATIEK